MRLLFLTLVALLARCSAAHKAADVAVAAMGFLLVNSEPELVLAQGDAGYLDGAGFGPQRHYYAQSADQTYIVGQVAIGSGAGVWVIAYYRGQPSTTPNSLTRTTPPGGVDVEVTDACGRPLAGVKVTVRLLDGGDYEYEECTGTDASGHVRFLPLGGGQWELEATGVKEEIRVAPRRIVAAHLAARR